MLAALAFLIFGGDRVPEKVRNLKGYSYLTGMVRDKLPEQFQIPAHLQDKFPFDLSFDLSFDLPNPASLLGGGEIPGKKKIMEDLAAYLEEEKSEQEFDSLEIEKRTTVEKEKKDTVYVITETKGEAGTESNYYRLRYKRHLISGWKLEEVKPYNVKGEKASVVGVSNKTVLSDEKIFTDISADWKHSNVKVLEHYTDVKSGVDAVVVYMELENEYVRMAGTKEIIYQYNKQAKEWEAVAVSKLTARSVEPVNRQ